MLARRAALRLRRAVAARALSTASADELFRGVRSTRWADEPQFVRELGTDFPVLRQMSPAGVLHDGVALPFSLAEAERMYRLMVQCHECDAFFEKVHRQGRITFYVTNFNEEAASLCSGAALQPQDLCWTQYRELGLFLWRGSTLDEIVDQNIGNEDDRGKGRNLQVHYSLLEKNVQCVHAVLGTHIPQAPGAGYAFQQEGADRISVAYFGDGAASEGDALAALNFAAVYGSQTLFICRNNAYWCASLLLWLSLHWLMLTS